MLKKVIEDPLIAFWGKSERKQTIKGINQKILKLLIGERHKELQEQEKRHPWLTLSSGSKFARVSVERICYLKDWVFVTTLLRISKWFEAQNMSKD